MSKPLVTILLSTYNGERYLEKQLNSLISQTYNNIEILIIDDASTDNTRLILKQYQDNDKISISLNEINKGFTQNFSDSLQLCKGEFIAFSDQDDIWDKKKIETLIDSIGLNDVIYHDSSFIDENGRGSGKSLRSFHNFVKGDCSPLLIYQNASSGHAMMIRQSFIARFTPIPEYIYHDWWISFCASCYGTITFVENKLVYYRIHKESYTQRNPTITFKERYRQLALFENYSKISNARSFRLLSKLNSLYKKKLEGRFSIPLFYTLLLNINILFFIRKRSLWSKIRNIIRECIA